MNKRVHIISSTRSGYTQRVACLTLGGQWLNEIGFTYQKLISVEYINNTLVIKVHENDINTYHKFFDDIYNKKMRLLQIGKKRGLPVFDIKGRWLEDFGFKTGEIALIQYEENCIILKVLAVDS